ncbi:hypothetical protein AcetOrient_orf03274 [Acetobacter orientalis]|uniref:Uncharacterized protein n=1 Tax=Acetobacter orientalis TaxID=146474 RepID=A0A2Z5ZJM2_9PROT|nr:hypothetical protein AcetOrient_orf03274 [Acetobacter orientalis]
MSFVRKQRVKGQIKAYFVACNRLFFSHLEASYPCVAA